jgi:hypothetical protein
MSLIHGVFEIWISSGSAGFPAEVAGSNFTWITVVLLAVSAVFALIGGVLAFYQRRSGGIFLIAAASICFFAHPYTRYYGGIYLVGGILTFFLRRPSEYGEDYEDEDEDGNQDEYEDEYDEDDANRDEEDDVLGGRLREKDKFRAISYGRRRERTSAFKGNKSGLDEDNFSRLNEPLRPRSSKVCPACGASVGIDHKFCYNCGGPLHTAPSPAEPKPEAYNSPSSPVIVSVGDDASRQEEPSQESPSLFKNLQTVFPSERSSPERSSSERSAKSGDNDDEADEFSAPAPSPHRVFVKPAEDSGPIIKQPLLINPDDSYRKFSDYTRRRKRRRHSLLRRVLGLSILLLAVGGAAWFLLRLPKVSKDDLPVPPPIPSPVDPVPNIAEPVVEEPMGGLPAIRIDSPARGVVVGSNVNVRPDHSISGAAITRLNADARVELLDQWEGVSGNLSGPWFRIRTGGREGWIYGQYLQPLDSRSSTLPEGYTASLLKTFGSTKEELAGQLGQPTRQTATTLTWSGLTVNFRGDSEITRLQVGSAKHVLLNGVAVGLTDEQLYKNVGYPSDYKGGQLRYIESGNQGMSVTMKNGKVQSITVGNI